MHAPDEPPITFLYPNIYESFLQEPPPHTPGQYLPYNFDDDGSFTRQNLIWFNGLKLEDDLRQKTLKCKQQDRSQVHPKWGPFLLCQK